MQDENFFETIEQQYSKARPFVCYRKPRASKVHAICQKNDALHVTKDLSESGFVFAPFDVDSDMIIIPLKASDCFDSDTISFETLNHQNLEFKSETESKSEYIALIENALVAIDRGEFKKVVISRKEEISLDDFNLFNVFKHLLQKYPLAFVYCWYHPKVGLWLGATPETLLAMEGQRFKTMALAGTQVYKGTINVDWGKKEKEEQQLVTDYIVDRLTSVVDAVSISERRTVKAGALLHLQTQISGRLHAEKSALLPIIKTLHPTPAVCGLPQSKAKSFILENEAYNREFYTGFMGELNFKTRKTRNTNSRNVENNVYATVKTTSNLYVNLRCMQVKGRQVNIYVGGGITKDSVSELEWEETVHKTETMKQVLF